MYNPYNTSYSVIILNIDLIMQRNFYKRPASEVRIGFNVMKYWENRTWIECKNSIEPIISRTDENVDSSASLSPGSSFRVLNYHVYCDCKSKVSHREKKKIWLNKSENIIAEIKFFNPDIITLQDVDHFADFWRPQLMILGYDSILKQRHQLKQPHYEGVGIAFKSELFQLFKTYHVDFNLTNSREDHGAAFPEKCKTDDVALILFLQPWKENFIESALCVVSAMIHDNPKDSDVRMAQCEYLSNQIEHANADFHLPVILGISLHDSDQSNAYSLLRTGRFPLKPRVPRKCKKPTGFPTSRSTVLLKWLPPNQDPNDVPILSYRLAWRPSLSHVLSFKSQMEVPLAECVKYVEVMDDHRNRRIVAQHELQRTIYGLSSEVPYEFRVAAINALGEGIWSDVSEIVVLSNAKKAPVLPKLVLLPDQNQFAISKELERMKGDDWNVLDAFVDDQMKAFTNVTPRDPTGRKLDGHLRGRVLPVTLNPRVSWDHETGRPDPRLVTELNREKQVNRSILRDRSGFLNKNLTAYSDQVGDSDYVIQSKRQLHGLEGGSQATEDKPEERVGKVQVEVEVVEGRSGSVEELEEVSNWDEDDSMMSLSTFLPFKAIKEEVITPNHAVGLNPAIERSHHPSMSQIASEKHRKVTGLDYLPDRSDVLHHLGVHNKRQVHDLLLFDVYERYFEVPTSQDSIASRSLGKDRSTHEAAARYTKVGPKEKTTSSLLPPMQGGSLDSRSTAADSISTNFRRGLENGNDPEGEMDDDDGEMEGEEEKGDGGDHVMECVDYLFVSSANLIVEQVLTIPPIHSLQLKSYLPQHNPMPPPRSKNPVEFHPIPVYNTTVEGIHDEAYEDSTTTLHSMTSSMMESSLPPIHGVTSLPSPSHPSPTINKSRSKDDDSIFYTPSHLPIGVQLSINTPMISSTWM